MKVISETYDDHSMYAMWDLVLVFFMWTIVKTACGKENIRLYTLKL